MKRLAALAAILALSLWCGRALADEPIRFGFSDEPYPPFYAKDQNGKFTGWEVELMQLVCAEMKAECAVVPTGWDGMIPSLLQHKIDVIWASMSITLERRQVIAFTDRYYLSQNIFIGPKSVPVSIDLAKPDGLKGLSVGVQTATIHASYLARHFDGTVDTKLYDTFDNATADLIAGRIDLVFADKISLDTFMKSAQGRDMEVKATAPLDPLLGQGVGGGLRKEDTALKARLDAALAAIRKDGRYDTLAKRYFDFDIYGG
jgi:polar amino acid transport system substrate-binding protein